MTSAPFAYQTERPTRRKLVTRSFAVDRADRLDRLGRDRVRLAPMPSGDPRRTVAYALVETEHDNILAADDIDPFSETERAA